MDKNFQQRLFYGSVAEKLDFARSTYRSHGSAVLLDGAVSTTLDDLKRDARQLNDHMAAMHMGELCVRCARKNGGGCCSSYMAGETDALQMLMNLLAGIEVKTVREEDDECCFLGKNGCIFLFKPMFCLNYNCTNIRNTASAGEMDRLEHLAGRLLGRQYEMEKRLLELLTAL